MKAFFGGLVSILFVLLIIYGIILLVSSTAHINDFGFHVACAFCVGVGLAVLAGIPIVTIGNSLNSNIKGLLEVIIFIALSVVFVTFIIMVWGNGGSGHVPKP